MDGERYGLDGWPIIVCKFFGLLPPVEEHRVYVSFVGLNESLEQHPCLRQVFDLAIVELLMNDGAGESPRMVRMSMGNQDGGRPNLLQPAKLIGAAIDHEPISASRYEQGAVPAMPPRAPLDFATGTEKDQIKLFGHMLAAKQVCGSMLFPLRYQERRDESVATAAAVNGRAGSTTPARELP